MPHFALPDALALELCDRLDTPFPSTFDDVTALYQAWIAQVPFDAIAKAISMAAGTSLPGADAVEVVERWLGTGVGSTCWGHCTAFAGVLGAAGIDCRIAADRMVRDDDLIDFHSFVVAELDDGRWAFDHIHATDEPLLLEPGASGTHGPYAAGFRRDDGRLVHWYANPERPGSDERYVVLATDLDRDDVRAFCEIARHFTGVRAGRLYARRFPPGGFVQGRPTDDGTAFEVIRWLGDERTLERHTDPEAALVALGYPAAALALVEQAGMVEVDGGVARWPTGPLT